MAFFGFITIVLLIYPRLHLRGQNIFLLASSYSFYGYWDWRFLFLLFTSTAVDFWAANSIQRSEDIRHRRLFLLASIAVNLGILGFFKYYNFFLDSAVSVLGYMGLKANTPVLKIVLPIGISFYTFKTMAYTIDVYRRNIAPTNHFIEYALFVSFFPQLLAGPIDKAKKFLPQISAPRSITRAKILTGLNLILVGYFKKVAIADTLAPIADNIFGDPGGMSSGQLWTGVYAYTFQIYGDFSGYTDIARGISLLLGFETIENFNAPYLSRNITEFWRRWHISLSTWFRDYVYIPLGGNRCGRARMHGNLIFTMLLCGLWHGAAWTFVLWGALHGVYLILHRMVKGEGGRGFSWLLSLPLWAKDLAKIFLTFHVVALTWILFRASNFEIVLQYFQGLFGFGLFTGLSIPVLFACSLLIALDAVRVHLASNTWLSDRQNFSVVRYAVAGVMLVSVIAASIGHLGTVTPFIYFQF